MAEPNQESGVWGSILLSKALGFPFITFKEISGIAVSRLSFREASQGPQQL